MVTDTKRQVVLLIGGGNGPVDLWEWNGSTWTERTPSTQPPYRDGHSLAYDEGRDRVVLAGGSGNFNTFETWEYDGLDWIQKTPVNSPAPRRSSAMAYDPIRRVVVLFGGYATPSGPQQTDTWEWNGDDWTLRSASLQNFPAQTGPQMAFDTNRGKMVLCDGTSTWEYPATNPVQVVSHPQDSVVCLAEGPVSFTVQAMGSPPLIYRWRRDGTELNLPSADTATLTIEAADFGTMGRYDCMVSNACGSVTSNSGELTVCAGTGGCPQPLDVNGDGVVDGLDIQRFVEVLLGY